MGRPFIDFTAVKAAVTFAQVLEHYGLTAKMHRTRNGDGLDGPCPIHPEATGKDTFKVTLSKNCWFCHLSACKCGGNHLDFVAKMENCDAHEAALKIDQWFNLGLAGKRTHLRHVNSKEAQPHLHAHGLDHLRPMETDLSPRLVPSHRNRWKSQARTHL